MPSIASIIRHTPWWAFGCLAIIVALGIQAWTGNTRSWRSPSRSSPACGWLFAPATRKQHSSIWCVPRRKSAPNWKAARHGTWRARYTSVARDAAARTSARGMPSCRWCEIPWATYLGRRAPGRVFRRWRDRAASPLRLHRRIDAVYHTRLMYQRAVNRKNCFPQRPQRPSVTTNSAWVASCGFSGTASCPARRHGA